MDFARSDEEKALAEALAQILGDVCSPARIRAWEADQVSFDDGFVSAVAGGGFLEAGLSFGDAPQFGVLAQLEEVAGRFLAPQLLSWQSAYAAFLLGDHPLASKVASGQLVAPLVPGRSELRLDGDRLSGAADGVPFLDRASALLIPLPSQLALVPLPQQWERFGEGAVADGLKAELVQTQSLVPQWRLTFDQTPAEVLAVAPDRSAQALNRLRTCLAAWATGAGSQAIELASAYARERVQFDHPIGSYQSVQNRLVDAAIQLEQARMLVYRAAALIDSGDPAAEDVSRLAKHHAGKAFAQAARGALMTFGGYGFTVDFDIQLYFRQAKEAQLSFEPRPSWELVPGFRS